MTTAVHELVLSLFPGADLLGMGFEREGFCVVRGPEWFLGQDIREFSPARHKFEGIIGGSPCQDFSKARRGVPVKPYACDVATRAEYGYGVAMIREFVRIVTSAEPLWFLHENVPGVPDVTVPGYVTQRIAINVTELGHNQNRWRTIQFGTRDGLKLVIPRGVTPAESHRTVLAGEWKSKSGLSLPDALELQGLSRHWRMPGLSPGQTFKAVGNGVPLPLGRALAAAVREREARRWVRACVCGCARPVRHGTTLATDACRQRVSREDRSQPRAVTLELAL